MSDKEKIVEGLEICTDTMNAMDRFGYCGDVTNLARSFMSSEGENIIGNFGTFVGKMGRNLRLNDKMEKPKELWILLDGLDSGLSIDRVIEVKNFIEWFANEEVPMAKETDVYIIMAVNAFEMCRGLRCLDVHNMNYVDFSDYEEYKKFVMESGEALKKRDGRED